MNTPFIFNFSSVQITYMGKEIAPYVEPARLNISVISETSDRSLQRVRVEVEGLPAPGGTNIYVVDREVALALPQRRDLAWFQDGVLVVRASNPR